MFHSSRKRLANLVIMAWVFSAGADGKITSIQFSAERVELTIRTTVDSTYQIQCCAHLIESSWIPTGVEFLATNSISRHSIAAPDLSCYFRVVKEGHSQTEEPIEPDTPPPPPPPRPGQ